FFFFVHRRPPGSTLFPYTTLFRSLGGLQVGRADHVAELLAAWLHLHRGSLDRPQHVAGALAGLEARAVAIQNLEHGQRLAALIGDRKSTRLNSSHDQTSYAVFCLK